MKVGFTCSCFDLFHAGHVTMLREERRHCDYLIVALQVDPTTDRPDTKNKPVQTIVERYSQLVAVKYVDEVVPYITEADLEDTFRTIKSEVLSLNSKLGLNKFRHTYNKTYYGYFVEYCRPYREESHSKTLTRI